MEGGTLAAHLPQGPGPQGILGAESITGVPLAPAFSSSADGLAHGTSADPSLLVRWTCL